MPTKGLYKTEVVIWTEYDPRTVELEDLVRDAVEGEGYCSKQVTTFVRKPEQDPEWDGTEFFDEDDDEDEDEEEVGDL